MKILIRKKMSEFLLTSLACPAGLALGMIFFGGLWVSTRKAVSARLPALWVFGSLILRTGIVLLGFYGVMQGGNWRNGLLCLIGFVAARYLVLYLSKGHELRLNGGIKQGKT